MLIRTQFSFSDVEDFANNKRDSMAINKFLAAVIKEWNLKDDEGNGMALTLENIAALDVPTFGAVMAFIEPYISPEKKG